MIRIVDSSVNAKSKMSSFPPPKKEALQGIVRYDGGLPSNTLCFAWHVPGGRIS